MLRVILAPLLFAFLGWSTRIQGQSREEILSQLQAAEDTLRDIPSRAQAALESIQNLPLVKQSPDLRFRVVKLMLEYESRMNIYGNTETLLEEARKLVQETRDLKSEIEYLQSLAAYAFEKEQLETVRSSLNRAYDLSIKIGDIDLQAGVLGELGDLDRTELNYQAALIHFLQAYELVKDRVDSDAYSTIVNSLALFYLGGLTVRYDQAVQFLEGLVEQTEKSPKPKRQDLQIFISNLGTAYLKKNLFEKAQTSFERALKLAVEVEDWTGVAYCQGYLGSVHMRKKKWEEAARSYHLAFNYFVKTKNQSMTVNTAESLMNIALELKDPKKAGEYWKVVQTANEKNLPLDERVEHLRLQGRLASLEKRWKEAYEAFNQMSKLDDKLNIQKNAESARYYTALYNIERKEQENIRLEQKGRVQVMQLDNARKQNDVLSWILISASIIATIFAVDFVRVRKRRKKIQDLTGNLQKNLLQRYLPNQMVQAVMDGKQSLDSSPHQRRFTLLHCELCDFNRAVDLLGPLRIGRILNIFLSEMMDVISNESGMIDKFMNGSLLVVFGAPGSMNDQEQAQAAIRAARKMQVKLDELNKVWQRSEGWVFAMRIGVHQGESLVGMLGSAHRIDYTVTGPVVDIASQICSRGSPGDTMVSSAIVPHLEGQQLLSVSRINAGVDGEIFSLLRASA